MFKFKITLFISFVVFTTWFSSAFADCWGFPRSFEAFSQNGKVVVQVTLRTEEHPTRFDVLSIEEGKRKLLWTANLPKQEVPLNVYVSNDGKHVITFDNAGHAGYGNYVVAVYNRDGLIKHFSLEQIIPPKESEFRAKVKTEIDRLSKIQNKQEEDREKLANLIRLNEWFLNEKSHYENQFPHSVSSRRWRQNSVGLFNDHETSYGLWVQWDNRWLVWDLNTGQLVPMTAEQTREWNHRARKVVLTRIKEEKADLADYEFLGKLKIPEDKPLVAKLLNDSNFRTGSGDSIRKNKTISNFFFSAQSDRRAMADRLLAQWEHTEPAKQKGYDGKSYHFLGSVTFTVSFPFAPRKQDGSLSAFLIPTDTQPTSQPIQRIIVNLYIYYLSEYNINQGIVLTKKVNFAILGVTPGSYKIKAMWDKEAPFNSDKAQVFAPSRGDYVSRNEPTVTITPGKTIDGISVTCNEIVK
jgi:hypothetical protein